MKDVPAAEDPKCPFAGTRPPDEILKLPVSRRPPLCKTDLRVANLAAADFRGADLTGANLSWANLFRASLNKASLTNAFLAQATLAGADLVEANLIVSPSSPGRRPAADGHNHGHRRPPPRLLLA